jgi:hypothetical protein
MALNGFQHHGNHLSKIFVLVKILLPLKNCGMIVSKRRLEWSQRPAKKVVTIT